LREAILASINALALASDSWIGWWHSSNMHQRFLVHCTCVISCTMSLNNKRPAILHSKNAVQCRWQGPSAIRK
jgi:hypothetical protein